MNGANGDRALPNGWAPVSRLPTRALAANVIRQAARGDGSAKNIAFDFTGDATFRGDLTSPQFMVRAIVTRAARLPQFQQGGIVKEVGPTTNGTNGATLDRVQSTIR